jgi:hypothetical protein
MFLRSFGYAWRCCWSRITVDVARAGTSTAGNEGNTEGAGGWTYSVQVEGKGEGKCRRRGEGEGMGGKAEKGEG